MKKGKPMVCRWCGRGIRRLPDGTHTHRARTTRRTSKRLDLGPIVLPPKTFVDNRPETVECYTVRFGMKKAEPKLSRVTEAGTR